MPDNPQPTPVAPKRFGELPAEEQKELLYESLVRGVAVEVLEENTGSWCLARYPVWDTNAYYRLRNSPPSIDWTVVAPEFRWLARNPNGQCFLYEQMPVKGNSIWLFLGPQHSAAPFASFHPGNCPWGQSLVERPDAR